MRSQIWHLAITDLVKTYRGAALGWFWLFARPAMYIFVFWFTLSLGLRSGKPVEGAPYILWLAAGSMPWFMMQSMIVTGGNIYHRFGYLVNRIKFPLSVISTFYVVSLMIVLLAELAIIVALCLVFGVHISRYILQLPLILVVMFVYWVAFSVMMSPLTALSKDLAQLLRTLSTPLFWLSGIIFHLDRLPEGAQMVMWFNPVSWFVQSVRDCFVFHTWIWERPGQLGAFVAVFLLTVLLAVRNYDRLSKEVPDVI